MLDKFLFTLTCWPVKPEATRSVGPSGDRRGQHALCQREVVILMKIFIASPLSSRFPSADSHKRVNVLSAWCVLTFRVIDQMTRLIGP